MRANFDTLVNDNKPVIVDFHALWCAPCKAQSPVLKEMAEELGDRIKIIKVDVDQNPEIASRYQVQSVPTLMIFKEGKLKYRQVGVHSKPQLMNILLNNV